MRRALFIFLLLISTSGFGKLVPKNVEEYEKVKKTLAGRGDFIKKDVFRLGNKTIKVEYIASLEGDYSLARTILPNFDKFPDWFLKDINTRSDGHKYYLQIPSLIVEHKNPDTIIGFQFALALPLFTHEGERKYKARMEDGEGFFRIAADNFPTDSTLISSSSASITVYPAEKEKERLWVYIAADVVIRSWLLYEALPEKMVNRESIERIRTVLNNYTHEEDRIRNLPPAPRNLGKKR